MKKIIAMALSLSLAVMLIASCSAMEHDSAPLMSVAEEPNSVWHDTETAGFSPDGGGAFHDSVAPPSFDHSYDMDDTFLDRPSSHGDDAEFVAAQTEQPPGAGGVPITAPVVDSTLADKIIYTVTAQLETVDFEETIVGVYEMLEVFGGFIENSNVSGIPIEHSHFGWHAYRTASFTLRIPRDRLNAAAAGLDRLGNVTSRMSDAENITVRFTDTEARLNSLAVQQERLLDMLRRAEEVTDMIAIEERLSDVRYQIESLTAIIRNWQNQLDYSTLRLFISEVEVYTEVPQMQQRTYWQRMGDGLQATVSSIGRFFMNVFMWLVINLPVFGMLALAAAVALIVVKKKLWRRKKKGVYDSPESKS